jgi:FK506-binding nuclear protein
MVVVTELENTFWGTVLKDKNKHELKLERPMRLSMASLDHKSVDTSTFVPVMIEQGGNSFLICTLSVPNVMQQSLNLEINAGETLNIYTETKAVVHLTGFYISELGYEDQDKSTNGVDKRVQYLSKCEDELCDEDHDDDDDDEFSDDDDDDEDEDDDENGDIDDEDIEEDDDELDEEQEEVMRQLAEMHASRKRKLNEKEPKKELKKAKNEKKPAKKAEIPEDEEEDALSGLDDTSDDDQEKEEKKKLEKTKKQEKQNKKQQDETKKVEGVEMKDSKVGHGPEAKKGKFVHVYYTGRLKSNGKVFDSCQQGKPFKFRLGSGQVIPGWEIGIQGMKVGGKRTLTIPPNKAYGSKKSGPIPANSTLVFDVELKSVS